MNLVLLCSSPLSHRSNADELVGLNAAVHERDGQRAGAEHGDAPVLHQPDGGRSDQADPGQAGAASGDVQGKSFPVSFSLFKVIRRIFRHPRHQILNSQVSPSLATFWSFSVCLARLTGCSCWREQSSRSTHALLKAGRQAVLAMIELFHFLRHHQRRVVLSPRV